MKGNPALMWHPINLKRRSFVVSVCQSSCVYVCMSLRQEDGWRSSQLQRVTSRQADTIPSARSSKGGKELESNCNQLERSEQQWEQQPHKSTADAVQQTERLQDPSASATRLYPSLSFKKGRSACSRQSLLRKEKGRERASERKNQASETHSKTNGSFEDTGRTTSVIARLEVSCTSLNPLPASDYRTRLGLRLKFAEKSVANCVCVCL